MVEIKVIPSKEDPVKQTAHYKNKNLQEQMLSFLNSNNEEGFIELNITINAIDKIALEEIKALDNLTVIDVCLLLLQHEYISHVEFKKFGWIIGRIINGEITSSSKKIVKHGQVLEILAKLFGYFTHSAVTAFMEKTNTDMVRNLRFNDNKSRVQVLSGEKFVRPSVTEKDILSRNK